MKGAFHRGLCPVCFAIVEIEQVIYVSSPRMTLPCGCEVGDERKHSDDDIPF